MDATAKARHIRQSARKVRQVLDEVRGTEGESALNKLHFSPTKASRVIELRVVTYDIIYFPWINYLADII